MAQPHTSKPRSVPPSVRQARMAALLDELREQVAWVEEHGQTLEGYRANYATDPEAIYAADLNALFNRAKRVAIEVSGPDAIGAAELAGRLRAALELLS